MSACHQKPEMNFDKKNLNAKYNVIFVIVRIKMLSIRCVDKNVLLKLTKINFAI